MYRGYNRRKAFGTERVPYLCPSCGFEGDLVASDVAFGDSSTERGVSAEQAAKKRLDSLVALARCCKCGYADERAIKKYTEAHDTKASPASLVVMGLAACAMYGYFDTSFPVTIGAFVVFYLALVKSFFRRVKPPPIEDLVSTEPRGATVVEMSTPADPAS